MFLNRLFLLLVLALISSASMADVDYRSQVDAIVASGKEPAGIVFEIVDRNWEYLDRAMPEIQGLVKKLRERFPGIDIAVVSHGFEQFGLTASQLNANEPLKKSVQSLVDSDIPIHVCGTFADWQGVDQSAFSKLVDVSPAGPAQINDYISLGYVKVVVTSKTEFE